jgi:hypothetical protein
MALQGHPLRNELLKPKLTVRQARTLMRDYRTGQGTQEDWQVGETRRYLNEALTHAKQALKYGHPTQAHLNPDVLRKALDNPPQAMAALRLGGNALITLADEVERALAPPAPPPMFDDATTNAT